MSSFEISSLFEKYIDVPAYGVVFMMSEYRSKAGEFERYTSDEMHDRITDADLVENVMYWLNIDTDMSQDGGYFIKYDGYYYFLNYEKFFWHATNDDDDHPDIRGCDWDFEMNLFHLLEDNHEDSPLLELASMSLNMCLMGL